MFKMAMTLALVSFFSLSLTACVKTNQNEQGGAIIGGVLGGLLGNKVGKGKGRVIATATGAAAGLLLGSHISK